MADAAYPEIELGGAKLRELQLERLRWTVDHAYRNNAHYRVAFDQLGVKPDDLRSLEDLARFPFTGKAELRARYPFGFFSVPMDKIARVHASSGTTGQPTVVGYTKGDLERWAQLVARSLYVAGGRPGMKVHVGYGYGLFTGGLGAHFGAEAGGYTVIPMSGGQTERQVQLIQDFKPDILMMTPSYTLAVVDEFRRQGLDPRKSSLSIGLFGAEPWTDGMRREIEASLDIKAVDIYGLSEVMGPGVASEFASHQGGPTIWEDHFLPEIVDPVTGAVLPDGERGELVFTSLTKEAMPVIRYRTRDLTRLIPGVASPMRRIDRIVGRSDDMLIIRGVNVFPTQIEELLLRVEGLAPHYEMVLTRPDRLDELLVRVEPRPDRAAEHHPTDSRQLAALIKDIVGVTAKIEICVVGALPRSAGKQAHVKDLRTAAK